MSDVSRSEAIERLSRINDNLCLSCAKLGCNDKQFCYDSKTIKKAISDIEKLQKIEEIVDEMWDENSYYNNTVRFAEKIEQILRGE